MTNLLRNFAILMVIMSCSANNNSFDITSPDERIKLSIFQDNKNYFHYLISFNNEIILDASNLGIEFTNIPDFKNNLKIVSI